MCASARGWALDHLPKRELTPASCLPLLPPSANAVKTNHELMFLEGASVTSSFPGRRRDGSTQGVPELTLAVPLSPLLPQT